MGKTAPRMLQLVDFVRETVGRTGNVPSYADIGRALRMEYPGTVRRAVKRAVAAGHLELAEDYRRKAGDVGGKRIRLGRSDEADRVVIKLGSEL